MQPATVLLAAFDLGGYVSVFKLIPVLLVLLGWARLATWIDKDAEAAHLPRELLNTVVLAGGVVSFALFLVLPNFWIALAALIVVQAATFGGYFGLRQRKVGLGDLKTEISGFAKGMVKREKKVKVVAGQVTLATGKGQVLAPPEDDSDPSAVGYETAQKLLTEPLQKGAERVEVRPSNGAAAVQFVVDGVAYTAASLDPTTAAAGITYLKKAAGLDIEEQRKPQTGKMRATLNGKKHDLEIASAGTTAGESLRVSIDPKKRFELRLDNLGLQPDQMAMLQQVISENPGIVLFAAPRGQGLTSMLYAVLRAHDAYVSHIQTIEHGPQEDLEGITQNTLAANVTAAEEFKQVEWVCSQQPDVLMIDEMTSSSSAQEVIRFAADGRRVYIGMHAGSTFDALTIWRRLVGDDNLASSQLRLVVAGRVMR
ncbi:MAG TPA: ATPase, T2SS/T4P/T4SS family, partial [Tepidisphaeraceae bacterium]|nr:ATPase, T2SS/T4P/T4SS family [Tepidisphaeraceae bacterium]